MFVVCRNDYCVPYTSQQNNFLLVGNYWCYWYVLEKGMRLNISNRSYWGRPAQEFSQLFVAILRPKSAQRPCICHLWDWFNTIQSLSYQGQICKFTFMEYLLPISCILWVGVFVYFSRWSARVNAALHINCVLWVMDCHYNLLFLIYSLNESCTILAIRVLNLLILLLALICWESGLDRRYNECFVPI